MSFSGQLSVIIQWDGALEPDPFQRHRMSHCHPAYRARDPMTSVVLAKLIVGREHPCILEDCRGCFHYAILFENKSDVCP